MNYNRLPCAGVIVYTQDENNNTYISIVQSKRGNWSYPKGKRHKGESAINAGLRELKEETGITINQIKMKEDVNPVIENSDKGNPAIVYFLAEFNDKINSKADLNLQIEDDEELISSKWVLLIDILKYDNEKRVNIIKYYDNLQKYF